MDDVAVALPAVVEESDDAVGDGVEESKSTLLNGVGRLTRPTLFVCQQASHSSSDRHPDRHRQLQAQENFELSEQQAASHRRQRINEQRAKDAALTALTGTNGGLPSWTMTASRSGAQKSSTLRTAPTGFVTPAKRLQVEHMQTTACSRQKTSDFTTSPQHPTQQALPASRAATPSQNNPHKLPALPDTHVSAASSSGGRVHGLKNANSTLVPTFAVPDSVTRREEQAGGAYSPRIPAQHRSPLDSANAQAPAAPSNHPRHAQNKNLQTPLPTTLPDPHTSQISSKSIFSSL